MADDDFFSAIEAGDLGGDRIVSSGGGGGTGGAAVDKVGDVGETVVESGEDEKHVVSDIFGGPETLDYVLSCGENPIFSLNRGRHC